LGLKAEIARVHNENVSVYGAWKLWRLFKREGIPVGRDHHHGRVAKEVAGS
jgi:hypothetical protein